MGKKTAVSPEDARILHTIKRSKWIILACLFAYLMIACVIVCNSFYYAFIINGKLKRKCSEQELLSLTISPNSITRKLNESSELHMDGAFVFYNNHIYYKRQNGDHYFELFDIDSEETPPFCDLATTSGYILDGIMINVIDDNTLLVHPQKWPHEKDDICTYSWRQNVYDGSKLNKIAVCEILRRQETEPISIGEAASIIGLIKEGTLLGYYNGCTLLSEEKKEGTLDLLWITRDQQEYREHITSIDTLKPITGIGNYAIFVDENGYLVTSAFGRTTRYSNEFLDQDMPVITYNAYLKDPTGEASTDQPLHVNILTKQAILTISQLSPGIADSFYRTAFDQSRLSDYTNICGNSFRLLLWNEKHYMNLGVNWDGTLEQY